MENESNHEAQKDLVALQIILTSDGKVKVVGPLLVDKTGSYGLLEMAKDAVREFHQPKIIKPGAMMNFVRGNGK